MEQKIKPGVLAAKLFVICFVASLVLALMNAKTEPIIADRQQKAQEAAMKEVYPEAEEIKEVDNKDALNDNVLAINEAVIGGQTDGYIFTVDSPKGYSGPVSFVVGVKADGTVTGFKVVKHSESQGFGSRVTDPEYTEGMQGVVLSAPVQAEGEGGGPDKVPAMSGATLTTKAMVGGFNAVVDSLSKLTGNEAASAPALTEVGDDDLKAVYAEGQAIQPLEGSGQENEVVKAIYSVDDGKGYVYHVLSPQAFGGKIEFLLGVNKDSEVQGFKVLQHQESEGFGAQIEDPGYADSMVGAKLSDGATPISGATFTSDALKTAFQAVATAHESLTK